MYLFNTTFVVEIPYVEPWKEWLAARFLANLGDALPHAEFDVYELDGRVEHTPGTRTFSCQCRCQTVGELREAEEFTSKLLDDPKGPKSMSVVYFCTMMKKVVL